MSLPFVMQVRGADGSSKQGRWWEKVDALELWHLLLEGLSSAKRFSEVADRLGETQSCGALYTHFNAETKYEPISLFIRGPYHL